MPTVHCARCGADKEALPRAPWSGELGERIGAEVCTSCWAEWQAMQTKVINEFRLNLADAEHAARLDSHMMVFLGLATAEELGLPAAPYGYGEGGPEGDGEEPP